MLLQYIPAKFIRAITLDGYPAPKSAPLQASKQPTLNKEDEQSSILRSMELHYHQLSLKYRPLKEIFRGTFIFRKSVAAGHGG